MEGKSGELLFFITLVLIDVMFDTPEIEQSSQETVILVDPKVVEKKRENLDQCTDRNTCIKRCTVSLWQHNLVRGRLD